MQTVAHHPVYFADCFLLLACSHLEVQVVVVVAWEGQLEEAVGVGLRQDRPLGRGFGRHFDRRSDQHLP